MNLKNVKSARFITITYKIYIYSKLCLEFRTASILIYSVFPIAIIAIDQLLIKLTVVQPIFFTIFSVFSAHSNANSVQ